jgi:hypothetical protein
MEFEKFIGGKFQMFTLPYMLSKPFSRKFLVAGVRPWTSHYLSLVSMLCNLRQDTFIDYLISECGLGQITVQPWAGHFY